MCTSINDAVDFPCHRNYLQDIVTIWRDILFHFFDDFIQFV